MSESLAQALFQSRTRAAVLDLLVVQGWTGSLSELARRVALTPRVVTREVRHLERLGLVKLEAVGGADVVRGNRAHPGARFVRGLLLCPALLDEELPDRLVRESLASWGAPLAGVHRTRALGLSATVLGGLALARLDGTVLRVLPSVLSANLASLDWPELKEGARRAKLKAELGWLLELTGALLGRNDLGVRAVDLRDRRRRALRFFPAARSSFEREVARQRSPARARAWGFWMNLSEDSFRATLERHRA